MTDDFTFGMTIISSKKILELQQSSKKVNIKVYGLLIVDSNVDVAKFTAVVSNIKIYGVVHAPQEIKSLYNL